jgi:transcriptional regulator with XRE-family HTH domain
VADDRKVHWGDWVIERSRVCGFRNQRELAEAIGCRAEQVSRWAQLERPPKQMRKGFDERLASALDLTTKELFRDYAHTPPSQAGLIIELPGVGKEPWQGDQWQTLDPSKQVAILLYMLGSEGKDVDRIIDFGIALVMAREVREGRKWSLLSGRLEHKPPVAERPEAKRPEKPVNPNKS